MFDLQHTLNLIDEGALDEAVDALETVIAQMPAYTPAYVLLAQTYEAQARWPEALHAWQRARFFAPNSPAIQDGLMRALEHQEIVLDGEEEDEESEGAPAPSGPTDDEGDELLDATHDEEASPAPPPPESEEASEVDRADAAHAPAAAHAPDPAPSPSSGPEESAQETQTEPEATPEPEAVAEAEEGPEAGEDDEQEPRDEASGREAGFPPSAEPRPSPLDELMRQLPDTDQPLPNDLQDLDRLIDELEGARIDPQPDVSDAPAPDLESDIDDMVSETLARIYISQNQYEEAARVYLRLASQEPDRAKEHLEKAAALRDRARDPDT